MTSSTTVTLNEEELRELIPELQNMTRKYKDAERAQKALFTISETAASVSDLNDLYLKIHDIIDSFMIAENIFVCAYDAVNDIYDYVYFIDEHDQLPIPQVPGDELRNSLTEHIVKHAKPLLLTKTQFPSYYAEHEIDLIGPQPHTLMAVPLESDGVTQGCIVVQSYTESVAYSQADLDVLSFVSQHINTAVERVQWREITERKIIERTRQYEEKNRELQEEIKNRENIEILQTALFDISELAANLTTDITEFYRKLHHALSQLINAPNCLIMLKSETIEPHLPHSHEQHDCVFFHHPEPELDRPTDLMLALTQYVFNTGQVELINSPQALDLAEKGSIDVLLAQDMIDTPQSWIGAPLIVDKQLLGMIAIQSYGVEYKYAQRDVEVMRFVSHHIAIALQRRRYADTLKEYNVSLEQTVAQRTAELERINAQLEEEIDKSKKAELKLMHDAFYDSLTGLANRGFFIQRLELAIANKKRFPKHNFAVVFIDLDRFKLVNDTLGHQAGDALLVEVARRLEIVIRSHDTLARFGGDEFVILLDQYADAENLEFITERILSTLGEPLIFADKPIMPAASLGIAVLTSEYNRADEAIRDADAAMYTAKSNGRGQRVFFTEDMRIELVESVELEKEFRQSMADSKFECFLQPVINVTSGETPYYECFIRWFHPTLGKIKRGQFWRIAEQSKLTTDIDDLLLEHACKHIRQRERQSNPPLVAINLSVSNLTQTQLTDRLLDRIKASGIKPEHLALEFSEYHFQNHSNVIYSAINKIKRAGIAVILDSFGAQSASINDLFAYPFDFVKLDKQYAQGLPRNLRHAKFIKAIHGVAEQLQCGLIVDGVETSEQQDILLDMGITLMQGNHISEAQHIYE